MTGDGFPSEGNQAELDAWVLAKIVQAERYLRSLPRWKYHWLKFKWLRIDPFICKLDCWLKGRVCPWE